VEAQVKHAERTRQSAVNAAMMVAVGVPLLVAAFELLAGAADARAARAPLSLFGGLIQTTITAEARITLLAAVYGGFGGLMTCAYRSVLGPARSVAGFGVLAFPVHTVLGACLGMLSFLCLRAIVLAPDAPATAISPYGITVIALFAGFFSPNVMQQLDAFVNRAFGTKEIGKSLDTRPAAGEGEGQAELLRAVDRLGDRIASLQVNPTLDNFDGTVGVRLLAVGGADLPQVVRGGRALPRAATGQVCHAIVAFRGGGSLGGQAFEGRVLVSGGREAEQVTFEVALDGEAIAFTPRGEATTFRPAKDTPRLDFVFTAPAEPGRYDIFVEVTQKNRLVQVVPAAIVVEHA